MNHSHFLTCIKWQIPFLSPHLLQTKCMERTFYTTAGICILAGASLATVTMILHPMGGDLAAIASMSSVFMFSHALSIFCTPLLGFGFWGLSAHLFTKNRAAFIGFAFICLGLVAALIAGTINGLVLPQYALKYAKSAVDPVTLHTIRSYGNFINLSADYILIGAVCIAIPVWSVLIIRTRQMPVWLGYYGLAITGLGITGLLTRFSYTSVTGFSIFIFGFVSWKILAGILLIRSASSK